MIFFFLIYFQTLLKLQDSKEMEKSIILIRNLDFDHRESKEIDLQIDFYKATNQL